MLKLNTIKIILRVYALVLSVFFVFRLILFFTEISRVDFSKDSFLDVIHAFLIGIRFDVVIAGYFLFFPAFFMLIFEIFNQLNQLVLKIFYWWTGIFFSLTFIICGADIPYFNQFFQRITVRAFEWFDTPLFVFKMIIQEPKYIVFFIPVIVLIYVFFKLLKRIFFKTYQPSKLKLVYKIVYSLLFLGFIFLGVRGRVQKKSPIMIGTAYFGDNSFLNQLGLNPVFTFMRSYFDSLNPDNNIVKLMDKNKAIKTVQKTLGIKEVKYDSPIARYVSKDTSKSSIKPNIVVVIMESMSAEKMTRHGNPNHLTPFLDSLSYQSLYFEKLYTAGKHTFNGIFSTQFSFPALFSQHTMATIRKYNGISYVLKNKGYSTTFFTTHDSQFDNMDGFLRENSFDEIINESNYPYDKIISTLGVPDDYMFEFSIPILNKKHQSGQPFYVSFMTSSDHGPYMVPDYFKPHSTEITQQTVEYADWSLRKFLYLAKQQPWFENTIFVFVADHGAPLSATYDISLDYHHSPLIIYNQTLVEQPKLISKIAGQIDIFPTLMGIINQPYVNNTLGIDILKNDRPYILINDDDKVGVLDDEFLLIMPKEGESKLYKYVNKDRNNYAKDYPDKVTEMELFAKSQLQVYQDMLLNNQQFIKD